MTVREIKSLLHTWVNQELTGIAGFEAAFYHGSITWLEDDDPFPPTSDVDLIVVADDPQQHATGKFTHGLLVLEVTYMPMEDFRTAEQVLDTFYLAGSFRRPGIIADRNGYFTKLQQEVQKEYPTAHWTRRRVEDAERRSRSFLEQTDKDLPLHDQVTNWLFARGLMVHMLLVAGLKNPTVRKRYVAVQQLLSAYQRADFHERLLQSAGFADLSQQTVEKHLATLTTAFDIARTVKTTPYRFGSDISITARPLTIDGSYELIRTGYHREAMFWIVATHCRCQHILSQDASAQVQQQQKAGYMQLLEDLRIDTFEERQVSNKEAGLFINEVKEMAETIIRTNINPA